MTQYDETVDYQRRLLKAEEWATGVKTLHAHSIDSCWYDDRPEDTANGRIVLDVEYNNGTVRRELDNGEVVIFGTPLTGRDLVDKFSKYTHE